MLIIHCSKVLFYLVLIYFPAASHRLLYANHLLQQGNLLSFGNMSLLQAIRCCMLIMYCSKGLFYLVLIYFPAASHTLLYANHLLQQGNLLSFVIFPAASHTLLYANYVLQQGIVLSCTYIFPCCKPYVVVR